MYCASAFVVQRSHRAARRVSFLIYLFAIHWNLRFCSHLLIIQIVHGHVVLWCMSWNWNLGNFFDYEKNRVFFCPSVNFACVLKKMLCLLRTAVPLNLFLPRKLPESFLLHLRWWGHIFWQSWKKSGFCLWICVWTLLTHISTYL